MAKDRKYMKNMQAAFIGRRFYAELMDALDEREIAYAEFGSREEMRGYGEERFGSAYALFAAAENTYGSPLEYAFLYCEADRDEVSELYKEIAAGHGPVKEFSYARVNDYDEMEVVRRLKSAGAEEIDSIRAGNHVRLYADVPQTVMKECAQGVFRETLEYMKEKGLTAGDAHRLYEAFGALPR